MTFGSFKICWEILSENTILTYKNAFAQRKAVKKSYAAKVLAAFGILSISAADSFGTFSIPGPKYLRN